MLEVKEVVRVPICITLPKECVAWLDQKVTSRAYASRSHAVEVLILDAMKKGKSRVLPL